MKLRILMVALAIAATAQICAEQYRRNDSDAVATCKKSCLSADAICHSECERSAGANFGYGIIDSVGAGVQTGTLGIIPTNKQAVNDYNVPKNFARGIKRLGVDAGRILTLGHVAQGNEHETNF